MDCRSEIGKTMARFGKFEIRSAGGSDIGRRRRKNEDALLLLEQHGIFCVADGVGGARKSELASQAVVDSLKSAFTVSESPLTDAERRDPESLVRTALNRASEWIYERAWQTDTAGMASTVVTLVFRRTVPERAFTLHAGDSRCYRLRDGHLELLTHDHSGADLPGFRNGGFIPQSFRNLITRAVGTFPRITLERTAVDVLSGDLFLLCSDGLNRMLPDERIAGILLERARGQSLQQTITALIRAANDAGGRDNITVILVSISEVTSS